jgi:hypothetical protein
MFKIITHHVFHNHDTHDVRQVPPKLSAIFWQAPLAYVVNFSLLAVDRKQHPH